MLGVEVPPEREALMHVYDFARRQVDGTWHCNSFRADDDDQAVQLALSLRTAELCELRRDDFLLASFDGLGSARATEGMLALMC